MRRRRLLFTLAAAVLAGCSLLSSPPVRYFEIQPTAGQPLPGAKLPALLVPDFSAVSPYDRLRVVIRKSPVELRADRTLQWATEPGRMLAQGLRARLQASERFESVRRQTSPQPPYAVDGQIEALEIDDVSHTVRLALRLSVRRTEDGVLIDQITSDEQQPVKSRRPADGILALRDIYSHMLDGLAERVIDAVRKDLPGAAAHARAPGGP